MTTDLGSFAASPLGAFLRSPLDARGQGQERTYYIACTERLNLWGLSGSLSTVGGSVTLSNNWRMQFTTWDDALPTWPDTEPAPFSGAWSTCRLRPNVTPVPPTPTPALIDCAGLTIGGSLYEPINDGMYALCQQGADGFRGHFYTWLIVGGDNSGYPTWPSDSGWRLSAFSGMGYTEATRVPFDGLA